jgi:hypothetical protein
MWDEGKVNVFRSSLWVGCETSYETLYSSAPGGTILSSVSTLIIGYTSSEMI